MQLDTEAATLLSTLQQQLNVVIDELCTAFATRFTYTHTHTHTCCLSQFCVT